MISWIQNVLERKGRIVFLILLAVVVVAFVFVIGETPGCVGGQPGGAVDRNYYGYNLNSEADTRELIQEVIISSLVNRGQRPRDSRMLQQEFLSRAALLHLAERAGVPSPSQQAFAAFLSEIPFFQGPDGNFDPNRVTSFLDMSELSRQFSEPVINRALNNDFRVRQLMDSLAPPGYTIPFDVEQQARRMNAFYDLATATLSRDAVEASFDPSKEEVETFFTQRVEAYRIPETRILSLAVFEPNSYVENVPDPTESELRDYFDANRSRYADPEAEDPKDALPTLEKARQEVLADWKAEQAEILARKASEDFVYRLFDEEIAMNSAAVEETAARFGTSLQSLPPLRGDQAPSGVELPQEALAEARRLDEIRYFSDPFPVENGVGVLLLEEVRASRIPELSEVREEVIADLRAEKEEEAFVARGEEIRESLQSRISQGESFVEAGEDLGLEVQSFPVASWENVPDGLRPSVLRRAETLPNGEVSPMSVNEQGGSFLFVRSRGAPPVDPDTERYEETRNFLASDNSRRFTSSFVNDLVQVGLARAEPESER